jgi:hypothetical protein
MFFNDKSVVWLAAIMFCFALSATTSDDAASLKAF